MIGYYLFAGAPVMIVRYLPYATAPFKFWRGNRNVTALVLAGVKRHHDGQ